MKFHTHSSPYFRRGSHVDFCLMLLKNRVAMYVLGGRGKSRDMLEGPLAVLKFFESIN